MFDFIYHHDIDPFIFEVGDGFGLRWYGAAYLVGFVVAYLILRLLSRSRRLHVTQEQALDLVIAGAVGGIIGARVGFVLFYNFSAFLARPWMLFAVWEGGMSFHGGLLGALACLIWYIRRARLAFWSVTDAGTLALTPALFFGRLANFINGELWGRPTDGSWGVVFPHSPKVDGELVPRHPSQLYQAATEGLLLFIILLFVWKYSHKPGRMSLTFLFGYGILRFLVEFYRAPDPHLDYVFALLTRGQIYSLLMVVSGLVLIKFLPTTSCNTA